MITEMIGSFPCLFLYLLFISSKIDIFYRGKDLLTIFFLSFENINSQFLHIQSYE